MTSKIAKEPLRWNMTNCFDVEKNQVLQLIPRWQVFCERSEIPQKVALVLGIADLRLKRCYIQPFDTYTRTKCASTANTVGLIFPDLLISGKTGHE